MTMIRVIDGQIIWPYSLGQLRADEPTKSFSSSPSDQELAVFGVFRVQATTPPEPDPAVERVVEGPPVLVDDQWQQQWEIVELSEAEKEAYYRATHPPQWLAFNDALPAEVNVILAQAQTIDHRLYLGFGVGLGKAADGDARVFLGVWQKASAAGLIPPEMIAQIQALATAHDLPVEFVAGLAGAQQQWQWPDSPARFQPWTAPDGSEWVYDQPRGADGQYLADDPETEEIESSLRWLPAGGGI